MQSMTHAALIERLCERYGARSKRFRKTVTEECDCVYWAEDYREEPHNAPMPDAFTISPGTPEDWFLFKVTAYEVEVTHRVTENKMDEYRHLFWVLDQDYVALDLVIVNRFGVETLIPWHFLSDAYPQGYP